MKNMRSNDSQRGRYNSISNTNLIIMLFWAPPDWTLNSSQANTLITVYVPFGYKGLTFHTNTKSQRTTHNGWLSVVAHMISHTHTLPHTGSGRVVTMVGRAGICLKQQTRGNLSWYVQWYGCSSVTLGAHSTLNVPRRCHACLKVDKPL